MSEFSYHTAEIHLGHAHRCLLLLCREQATVLACTLSSELVFVELKYWGAINPRWILYCPLSRAWYVMARSFRVPVHQRRVFDAQDMGISGVSQRRRINDLYAECIIRKKANEIRSHVDNKSEQSSFLGKV